MKLSIREAVPEDASAMVVIAEQLKMPLDPAEAHQLRGFLLDISLEQYRYFLSNDEVLVLESGEEDELIGFSIVLGPESMELTGLRQKAAQISWGDLSFDRLDPAQCAYFEQIAVLPGRASGNPVIYLALTSLLRTFRKYEYLFAAVVSRPVINRAPRRLLTAAGMQRVGTIKEQYPEFGSITYDIYWLSRTEFDARLKEPLLGGMLKRMRNRLHQNLPLNGREP